MGLKPKWLHQFEVTQNQKAEWDKLQQSFGFLRGDLVMLYQDMQPEPKPAAFKAFTSASMYIRSIGFKMQLCRHALVQCIYIHMQINWTTKKIALRSHPWPPPTPSMCSPSSSSSSSWRMCVGVSACPDWWPALICLGSRPSCNQNDNQPISC